MSQRAAVTGGTGFVGAALIEKLLAEGWDVTALARNPAALTRADEVRVVKGTLEDDGALNDLANGADIFFHLAGLTHAHNADDYHRVNVVGAQAAARAAASAGATFIHTSSMSARNPDVSPYAKSKFDSEAAIKSTSGGNPWLALRLPAIYGPHDMATLPYFKLIKSGLALEPKTTMPARASILYVDDAASALVSAAQGAPAGRVYEVGDERADGFAWSEIGAILAQTLGKPARPLRLPRPVVTAYHGLMRTSERALGRPPSLREGQVREFFHPDWVARDNLLSDSCNWRPETPLQEGFAKTVRWYQEHGLL